MGLTDKNTIHEITDVCVIGAGHAGCEAALACAGLGLETVLFTVSVDSIALMPCNPNVGGSSKGHLVRELDALGGEMGKVIDRTFIQSKMLNLSKGPAVHSLRAQADKAEYSREMRKHLEAKEHLRIKQGEVCEIVTKEDAKGQTICGVRSYTGAFYECKALIIATGTYLNARCLSGEAITHTGPNGLQAATHLSDSLREHGVVLRRFKTGTPARMDGSSLDYSKMEPQHGDERVVPFSFSTDPESVQIEQADCYLTYTNEETHRIIRENLDRSPLFAGVIEGTGPRYCPSIEDKVVRFPEKERHQVFIEPEGLHTGEMYVGGMSSSLPEDVQLAMYRTVPGLENCRIVRNAYAIEYDCLGPGQLKLSLELKAIGGVFCAGQFNGSSGYEEAAAQGLIAGINAACRIKGREPLVLDRSEAYIGVLIDDLVNKENNEPYRMMTSRAEYRLLLRQDNADLRLRHYGYELGLVSREQMEYVEKKQRLIDAECARLHRHYVGANERVQAFLEEKGTAPIRKATTLAELISRPELDYDIVSELESIPGLVHLSNEEPGKEEEKEKEESALQEAEGDARLRADVVEQININIKYEGYIRRQQAQVEAFKKTESRRIPEDIDYDDVKSLRLEARQKLKMFRPESVGQASRISGVSPADVTVLLVYLEQNKRRQTEQ
ncbi:MAG: tRNA uridine-5-carboxymethylaminomethyl(34) synthesis enzyme MnmG [Lachnospiraceae bacterium]|nr:tRNA uridine-5-carboxymethylaminomethyl(34) synthesis enzyme MnmG [Lachnospiraceae bacterium]